MRLKLIVRNILVALICSISVTTTSVVLAEPSVSKADVENAANAGDFEKAYELLVQLAESGNAQAQGFLAYVLYEGEWGVAVDAVRAKSWMEKALAQNDAYAHYFVADINARGLVDSDDNESVLIKTDDIEGNIVIAAQGGHPAALFYLGSQALTGKDHSEAAKWFHKASITGGDFYKVYQLIAEAYANNFEDFDPSQLESLRHTGNVHGNRTLALEFFTGRHIPKDYQKAYTYASYAWTLQDTEAEEFSRRLSQVIPLQEGMKLWGDAASDILGWAKDRGTNLGQALAFCFRYGQPVYDAESKICIQQAVEDHQNCSTAYVLWGFQDYINYPAYQVCRAHSS